MILKVFKFSLCILCTCWTWWTDSRFDLVYRTNRTPTGNLLWHTCCLKICIKIDHFIIFSRSQMFQVSLIKNVLFLSYPEENLSWDVCLHELHEVLTMPSARSWTRDSCQPQLSQPVLIGDVLLPSDNLRGPPLESLQQVRALQKRKMFCGVNLEMDVKFILRPSSWSYV